MDGLIIMAMKVLSTSACDEVLNMILRPRGLTSCQCW
jgi:hypothetical protein